MISLLVAIVGLVLGSFATALAYRVPRGIPWAMSKSYEPVRSACTSCNKSLKISDLIPVFSWLINRGMCRHCKKSISFYYPATELMVMMASICAYLIFGLSVQAFFLIAALPFLAALFLIDIETLTLPDQLTGVLAVLGIGFLAVNIFWAQSITLTAALYEYGVAVLLYGWVAWLMGAIMSRFVGQSALGFGDVKFFAIAGLWLGVANMGWFFALSGILGVGFAIIWRLYKGNQVFPFGPALIAAFFVLFILQGSLSA